MAASWAAYRGRSARGVPGRGSPRLGHHPAQLLLLQPQLLLLLAQLLLLQAQLLLLLAQRPLLLEQAGVGRRSLERAVGVRGPSHPIDDRHTLRQLCSCCLQAGEAVRDLSGARHHTGEKQQVDVGPLQSGTVQDTRGEQKGTKARSGLARTAGKAGRCYNRCSCGSQHPCETQPRMLLESTAASRLTVKKLVMSHCQLEPE